MRSTLTTYDWAAMISQLREAGIATSDISKAMDTSLTVRMIHAYRAGSQPLYYRGNLLLAFWCETMRKSPEDAPRAEVRRGHRVDRRLTIGPRVQTLPQWPPAAAPSVAPIKRRGRPKKVAA